MQRQPMDVIGRKIAALVIIFSFIWQTACEVVSAQPVPDPYPDKVDLGVQGITLNYRESTEKVLGREVTFEKIEHQTARLICLNQNGSEALTLLNHNAAIPNSVQEFNVGPAEPGAVDQCGLSGIRTFISGRGIRLGMGASQLIRMLGPDYRARGSGSDVVMEYSIKGNAYSPFLQHYGEGEYFGHYTLRNGKLIKFRFGFGSGA